MIVTVTTGFGALWGAVTAVGQIVDLWQRWTGSPHVALMLRTPRLGFQFWQNGTQNEIQFQDEKQLEVVRVPMKRIPFEMRFPKQNRDVAVQVCAWNDDSIFTLHVGQRVADIPFFRPGTGMADYQYGSGTLMLNSEGHNHLIDTRVEEVSDSTDRVYFGQTLGDDRRETPLTRRARDLYLAVLVDRDNDGVVDPGEFEFVILRFE